MAKTPPPLPAEVLVRVLTVAARDGRILLFLAGGCALLSAAGHDGFGALIGLIVAGLGAVELHGVTLLQRGEPRGLDWLIRSQLLLLATILLYAAVKVSNFDEAAWNARITPEMLTQLDQINATREQFLDMLRFLYVGMYTLIGIVSIFYQGGMVFYYHRSRGAIAQALADNEPESVDDFAG